VNGKGYPRTGEQDLQSASVTCAIASCGAARAWAKDHGIAGERLLPDQVPDWPSAR